MGKEDLYGGLGWFFTWLGLLGGIALIVWSANHFGNQSQKICIANHGNWTAIDDHYIGDRYYTCVYGRIK